MKPDAVLEHASLVLSGEQRNQYFDRGYLAVPGAISPQWVSRLKAAVAAVTDDSRKISTNDAYFQLEEGHSARTPRLHRLSSPQNYNPVFWEFLCSDEMTALAADVVGPAVKFHHAKLNFKTGHGSRAFKWHQDIQAWPHTDYSPVTVGVYIDGCEADQGPLTMVPGSNHGPLYSMYDAAGNFAVKVRDEDIAWLTPDMLDAPTGPPGTAVLLNCRTIHGSVNNDSDRNRPLLLAVYSSADSFSYTSSPIDSPQLGAIVRGQPATYASFDDRPCELPPDWKRTGYAGPWKLQQDEEQHHRAEQVSKEVPS